MLRFSGRAWALTQRLSIIFTEAPIIPSKAAVPLLYQHNILSLLLL